MYMKERKLYLERKLAVNRSEKQVDIVIFGDSLTNNITYHIFNQKLKDHRARFNFFISLDSNSIIQIITGHIAQCKFNIRRIRI